MREFTSGPADGEEEQDQAPPQSPVIDFKLDGEKFTVAVDLDDGDALLEWSELAETAVTADADMNSAAGAAFTARFFRLTLGPDYPRFRAHMRAHHTRAPRLLEIMQAINEEMEAAVEGEADRPTAPSSRSSTGRGGRDGRTLEIVSMAGGDGEVVFAPPALAPPPPPSPPQRGQPRRGGRRPQDRRRRAG
jgi:hypothetical protein